ncbi:MAG: hypothetical protein RL215_1492 [Planctomycetota bacterium]
MIGVLLEAEGDGAIWGCMFESIIEEVGEDRAEGLLVGVEGELSGAELLEVDIPGIGEWFEGAEDICGDGGGIEGFEMQDFLS